MAEELRPGEPESGEPQPKENRRFNPEHYEIVKNGKDAIDEWRKANPAGVLELEGADLTKADLTQANLGGANLGGANLSGANLGDADLSGANLGDADLRNAQLPHANLRYANLTYADMTGANLTHADMTGANLSSAALSGANLSRAFLSPADLRYADMTGANLALADMRNAALSCANLTQANLTHANLRAADLTAADLSGAQLKYAMLVRATLVATTVEQTSFVRCNVYGASVWDVKGVPAAQSGLVITPENEPAITVDNLKVAQFIYLLLYNEEIRDVIDTITSKVVLILGRFTEERKAVLDSLREELRRSPYDYVPVVFDFDKPRSKTTEETVMTLARMARFVIADLTDAKSVLQELSSIVKGCPSLPVQPLLLSEQHEPGMWDSFKPYSWLLETVRYDSLENLLATLPAVVAPVEAKARELREA